MVQGAVGYCPCGQEIWIEYLRDGQAWRPRFLDDEQREATLCPNCGQQLQEDALEPLGD